MELSTDVGTTRTVRTRRTETQDLRERVEELQLHIQGLNTLHRDALEAAEAKFSAMVKEKDDYIADRAIEHNSKMAEEVKQHGYTKSNKDSYYRQFQDHDAELNAMHEVLDLIGAPERKFIPTGSTYEAERKLLTRFAGWQAKQAQYLANK